jgi:hypothetical protein
MESFWDEDQSTATERYLILEENSPIAHYASTTQAYSPEEITRLLTSCGFEKISFHDSLTGQATPSPEDFFVIVAEKA